MLLNRSYCGHWTASKLRNTISLTRFNDVIKPELLWTLDSIQTRKTISLTRFNDVIKLELLWTASMQLWAVSSPLWDMVTITLNIFNNLQCCSK